MTDLLEQINAAMDEDERIASFAMRFRNAYRESGLVETWEAKRYVNNETPPYFDFWAVESRLGAWGPKPVLRIEEFAAELDARYFTRFDPARALRQVAANRLALASHQYEGDPWGCISCERNPAVGYTRHDGWCDGVLSLAKVYEIEIVVLAGE